MRAYWVIIFLLFLVAACSDSSPVNNNQQKKPGLQASKAENNRSVGQTCKQYYPNKNAFFGDVHIHTKYSFDSYSWDVRNDPDDAYRFAKGDPLKIPGIAGERIVQLDVPLDFAAITDHAEFLGEVAICTNENETAYQSAFCRQYRGDVEGERGATNLLARLLRFIPIISSDSPSRDEEVCDTDGGYCHSVSQNVWQRIQEAAARHNDTSDDCRFTTFIGYEYTGVPHLSNIHRNMIFRNENVPETPVSYIEAPEPWQLWESLQRDCLDAGNGCDVIGIPHNSNLSNGRMFTSMYNSEIDNSRAVKQRANIERLIEIYQHKGESECTNGLAAILGSPDEFCNFEKIYMEFEDCRDRVGEGGISAIKGMDRCVSHRNFTRYILAEGIRDQEKIGENPFKLGMVAATDTHNGTPGAVDENDYAGHFGIGEATLKDRLEVLFGTGVFSAGGITGVWAEENSRDKLFGAMKKRETFATSGPRIRPRFFAGWDIPEDICEQPDMISIAYKKGHPMGSELKQNKTGKRSPGFLVSASRDPGSKNRTGGLLQRIQIIKIWPVAGGKIEQRIYDVAGGNNNASVDMDTCTPQGEGWNNLCAYWRDPDFNPDQSVAYYSRVMENPSCRFNAWQCMQADPDERPEACNDPNVAKTIQERAWTSPIWYTAQ